MDNGMMDNMKNTNRKTFAPALLALMLAALALLPLPALARGSETNISPDSVVATVDGIPITEEELAFAAEDMAQDLRSIPPAEQRALLTRVLIDMKLLANAARALNLNEGELFERRLRYLEERALRRAYFVSQINETISRQDVMAAYETFAASQVPEEELRARHILLASLEDAQVVRQELDAGRDFAELAREKSTGPSGPNGGDLGFFGRGRMVKEFEDAVFSMEVGEISDPVQTQFGWHIIKLEERRQSKPPAFEQVADQIRQQLLVDRFDQTVERLKSSAVIEITDPGIRAVLEQAPGAN